jgi:hypothetical protein
MTDFRFEEKMSKIRKAGEAGQKERETFDGQPVSVAVI